MAFDIFGGVFFVESLQVLRTKTPNFLTKRPPVATNVSSDIQRHPWGIGIPGYTFGSSIQARAIPPPSWSVQSSVGVPTFNSTEKALTFTIYDCILKKR